MRGVIIIFLRDISNKLELPTDVILGDSMIEIMGRNSLYIENYKRILLFQKENIVIQCKCYRIEICGKNLKLEYYNDTELKVTGVFDGISFC